MLIGFRAWLAVAFLSLSGCQYFMGVNDIPKYLELQANPDLTKLDLDLFDANIKTQLGTQWDGYGYIINQFGRERKNGVYGTFYKNIFNAPPDLDAPVYAASINKFVTAAAALKVMEEESNLGIAAVLASPITAYLPIEWSQSNFIKGITVGMLLSHRSGIPNKYDSDYGTIKGICQNGVDTAKAGYTYSNANFGFLRMFIAAMSGTSVGGSDLEIRQKSENGFILYMTDIFDAIGVAPSLVPSYVRYYQWNTQKPEWDIGDKSGNLGSGGYYWSIRDYAKFAAYLNHTETIISTGARKILYQNFYGLTDISSPPLTNNGLHGMYYSKGGTLSSNGRGVRTLIMVLPNAVEVVFMTNSRGGALDGNTTLPAAIAKAYDDSWK